MGNERLFLVPLGFVIGALGTLIGAGGGFVLVPVLLFLWPQESPGTITSISLAVVAANGLAGSVAYARKGRIHYRSAGWFTVAAIPGALLGAWATAHLPRRLFEVAFGVVMLAGSLWLLAKPGPAEREPEDASPVPPGHWDCEVVERDGTRHRFHFDPVWGMAVSALVGLVAVLLGIGGGIVHVPILSYRLRFPVHVATATSHLVLGATAAIGTLAHIALGAFDHGLHRAGLLALGAVFGAQVGAWLSDRVRGGAILKALAVALGLVGVRLLLR